MKLTTILIFIKIKYTYVTNIHINGRNNKISIMLKDNDGQLVGGKQALVSSKLSRDF